MQLFLPQNQGIGPNTFSAINDLLTMNKKNILNRKSQTNIDCIRLKPGNEMVQTPMSCLDTMDMALLTLSFLSILGVGFGLFVACKYGNKVFNQSHSSGRDATIWIGKIDKNFCIFYFNFSS